MFLFATSMFFLLSFFVGAVYTDALTKRRCFVNAPTFLLQLFMQTTNLMIEKKVWNKGRKIRIRNANETSEMWSSQIAFGSRLILMPFNAFESQSVRQHTSQRKESNNNICLEQTQTQILLSAHSIEEDFFFSVLNSLCLKNYHSAPDSQAIWLVTANLFEAS